MCEPFKTWGSLLISKHGIGVVGFIMAAFVYSDLRTMVKEFAETSAKQTEILRTMDTRLSNLEHK